MEGEDSVFNKIQKEMRILQLCHKPPMPAVDGGCIAINNITQGLLCAGHQVKVLSVATPKHPYRPDALPEDYLEKTRFETVFVDTRIKYFEALSFLLRGLSYHVYRFFSKEMSKKLIQVLQDQNFDIVQIESIFVTPYIPIIRQYSKAKIVVRLHNIEHLIWERIAQNHLSCGKKILLEKMNRQLKNYECSLMSKVDGYMAISEVDDKFFREVAGDTPGRVIPFGINVDDYESEEDYIPSDKPELFHIGSMNWLPNVEGLEWFLDDIFPLILQHFPHLTFDIAGRGIPEKIREYRSDNVHIVGEVESANEFMLEKDIMVVPLLSGSGIRIKIIEGMALGKTIITTSVGAEGLEVENGKNIFIADTAEEFLKVIEKCVNTPDICTIIGENARNYVALHHNSELITHDLIDFYNEISR